MCEPSTKGVHAPAHTIARALQQTLTFTCNALTCRPVEACSSNDSSVRFQCQSITLRPYTRQPQNLMPLLLVLPLLPPLGTARPGQTPLANRCLRHINCQPSLSLARLVRRWPGNPPHPTATKHRQRDPPTPQDSTHRSACLASPTGNIGEEAGGPARAWALHSKTTSTLPWVMTRVSPMEGATT